MPEILEFQPIGLEGFEGSLVDGLRKKGAPNLDLMPEGRGYLLVEFGFNDPEQARQTAEHFIERMEQLADPPNARLYTATEARAMWKIRESGPRAAATAPGAPLEWEGWDDSAVAPEKLGAYLRELRALLDEYHYQTAFYGHFGHGCIHMRVNWDLETEQGVRQYGEFVDRAADLVVSYGGSLSGEHGDGQSRGALLPKMFGNELMGAFREFKSVWDPDRKMNPGKLVDAYLPTENLRLGADYAPQRPLTHFAFPDDKGSFERAMLRCVGLGECRKHDSGTMCPSYMVTLEEEHSTRGRAHMLFELLQGEVVGSGWKDEHVKRSLDLCLSCKACKSECPANVDMATYRAEFLSHYYEGRSRPLNAYAFGMIDRWLELAAFAPRLANVALDVPWLSLIMRRALHIAPERQLPKVAPVNFRKWARRHGVRTTSTPRSQTPTRDDVILWVDTFNNHFHPETSQAALRVLRAAGFDVSIPASGCAAAGRSTTSACSTGRKQYLQTVMASLGDAIDAGVPIVVLEPSCASVFRDELRNLFPNDDRATRLRSQTFLLSEILESRGVAYEPPRLARKVLLHGHCHHKAIMKLGPEESLLRRMGADVQSPDSGCCGMAGAFGFEAEKYAVSQAVGERVLLPAVRQADTDTVIVADGFSCREQIRQATGRHAIHLADALDLALSANAR